MSSRSTEAGGDKTSNLGLSNFKVFPEHRGVGPRAQKPGERPLSSKPTEQKGESKSFQPNPVEQQAGERLGKPPPEEAASTIDNSVQEQDEPQAGGQEQPDDLDFDIDFKPLPPVTWVGPFGRLRPKRINRDDQK
jgi:hypothetical protein